ncbi:MAG: IclR family transcriptional regulator [Chloroflexi bacterium]|nr:IclR family transcriptional regulator [Chloroflexota bacterium]
MARRLREGVQSVGRALDLFERLVSAERELGLRDLGEACALPVGTVHRLLGSLVERGYARQNPATRRYTVGPNALELARRILARDDLPSRAEPFLRRLAQLTGESANLAALDGSQAVYLVHAAPPRTIRMFTEVGNRAPLYATGTGKVLLAHLEPVRLDAILGRLELRAYTPTTLTTREGLLAELAKIRRRGHAHDDGEFEEGAHCIAVPVRDGTQRVVAALSISGPTSRLTRERADAWLPQVQEIARELSEALGAQRQRPAAAAGVCQPMVPETTILGVTRAEHD